MPRTGAELLIAMAGKLIPPCKEDWGRAMAAEVAQLSGDGAALGFAAGCVWAACKERVRSWAPACAWLEPGAAVAALVLLHALIAGSGEWPLLWPLLGGAAAVLSVGARDGLLSFASAVGTGAKAGAAGALLLLAGAALCLKGVVVNDGLSTDKLVVFAVAAVAVFGLATISGLAVAPFVSRPPGSKRMEEG